jgi:nitrate reductase NapE component
MRPAYDATGARSYPNHVVDQRAWPHMGVRTDRGSGTLSSSDRPAAEAERMSTMGGRDPAMRKRVAAFSFYALMVVLFPVTLVGFVIWAGKLLFVRTPGISTTAQGSWGGFAIAIVE